MRERDMRRPTSQAQTTPVAKEVPGVQCASGSVRLSPSGEHCQSKAPFVQSRRPEGEPEVARAKDPGVTDPPNVQRNPDSRLSPAYMKPDEGIWDQSYLSKALQMMKDSEMAKLRLPATCNKPLEYEKWLLNVNTTMKGLHPEIGNYWSRVSSSAVPAFF